MTLSLKERDEVWRKCETLLGTQMRAIYEAANSGAITYDADVWEAILEWLAGPVQKRVLYGPNVPPEKRGDRNAFIYTKFEIFTRLKKEGTLSGPLLVSTALAMAFALGGFRDELLALLKVKVKPGHEGEALMEIAGDLDPAMYMGVEDAPQLADKS